MSMGETKRKTHTSWQVKNRYNEKAYKRFQSQIKPDLFEEIEDYMKLHGLSRSQFLKLAIEALKNNETTT